MTLADHRFDVFCWRMIFLSLVAMAVLIAIDRVWPQRHDWREIFTLEAEYRQAMPGCRKGLCLVHFGSDDKPIVEMYHKQQ